MSAFRRQVIAAFAEIRPWPARLEVSPQQYQLLREGAKKGEFETDGTHKFRGVPIRVRPLLRGWRVTAESRQAAAAALSDRGEPVLYDPREAPDRIESDDFDESEALAFERGIGKSKNTDARQIGPGVGTRPPRRR